MNETCVMTGKATYSRRKSILKNINMTGYLSNLTCQSSRDQSRTCILQLSSSLDVSVTYIQMQENCQGYMSTTGKHEPITKAGPVDSIAKSTSLSVLLFNLPFVVPSILFF